MVQPGVDNKNVIVTSEAYESQAGCCVANLKVGFTSRNGIRTSLSSDMKVAALTESRFPVADWQRVGAIANQAARLCRKGPHS